MAYLPPTGLKPFNDYLCRPLTVGVTQADCQDLDLTSYLQNSGLDFETFELTGPSLTHFPIGSCDLDRLVIFTVSQV